MLWSVSYPNLIRRKNYRFSALMRNMTLPVRAAPVKTRAEGRAKTVSGYTR